MADEKDWRLRGQEDHLQGASLIRKQYKAWSDEWEHDHCEFCWAKFMDPNFSPDHKRFIAEDPDVLTEGYAPLIDNPARYKLTSPHRTFRTDRWGQRIRICLATAKKGSSPNTSTRFWPTIS